VSKQIRVLLGGLAVRKHVTDLDAEYIALTRAKQCNCGLGAFVGHLDRLKRTHRLIRLSHTFMHVDCGALIVLETAPVRPAFVRPKGAPNKWFGVE
jgi:hypothetical protein